MHRASRTREGYFKVHSKLFKKNMGTVDHAVKMPCIDMSNVQCVDGGMILNALNKFE